MVRRSDKLFGRTPTGTDELMPWNWRNSNAVHDALAA